MTFKITLSSFTQNENFPKFEVFSGWILGIFIWIYFLGIYLFFYDLVRLSEGENTSFALFSVDTLPNQSHLFFYSFWANLVIHFMWCFFYKASTESWANEEEFGAATEGTWWEVECIRQGKGSLGRAVWREKTIIGKLKRVSKTSFHFDIISFLIWCFPVFSLFLAVHPHSLNSSSYSSLILPFSFFTFSLFLSLSLSLSLSHLDLIAVFLFLFVFYFFFLSFLKCLRFMWLFLWMILNFSILLKRFFFVRLCKCHYFNLSVYCCCCCY